jgi:hypothetical protein
MKWCDQGLLVISKHTADAAKAKDEENRKKLNNMRIKAEVAKVNNKPLYVNIKQFVIPLIFLEISRA